MGVLHPFRRGTAEDFRQANPFGIFVAWRDQRTAKLLQRAPVAGCPLVHSITMTADFPVVTLSFADPEIPAQVQVTHFSPFVPQDAKHSALPVVVSLFSLTNPTDFPMTISVLACSVNVVGAWNVGRYNRLLRQAGLLGLVHRRRGHDPRDARAGELALMTELPAAMRSRGRRPLPPPDREVTYLTQWMYANEGFRANSEDRRVEAWPYFSRDGRLPNVAGDGEAMGERDEPMGAVAVRLTLAPHATREVPFYYSWFMPNHRYGHRYQRWFRSAGDVVRYVHPRRRRLLDATRAWQRTVRSAGLPDWLADGLINTLTAYTAASWWTRDGRFAICENPVKWPLMDSLDVRYYGTLPLACWFPKLEQSTLLQFARAQRADGRIPHDLGRLQLDCPSDGTTAGAPWKDLSIKFALMAYRDALWSGDRRFLRRIYPHVRRAILWELTTDRNGDGLPDHEGQDTTFDLWSFAGAGAYTAGIFLAALRAGERMARQQQDQAFARRCRQWFRRAAAAMETKLWAGAYYLAARRDDGSTDEACTASQLNGQWYAHLLGLGYVLPEARVKPAVRTMLALNGQASRFGAVNAVFPDGRIDESSYHAKNIWPGVTYALAALAIYEGCVAEGLALAERMWATFATHNQNVWSQPDVVMASDGSVGDGELYVRNVAIWAIPWALARTDGRVRRMLLTLAPQLPLSSSPRRSMELCL